MYNDINVDAAITVVIDDIDNNGVIKNTNLEAIDIYIKTIGFID